MRNARARGVSMVTMFGVLALSVGLVRLVFMPDSAIAEKDEKGRGSATDLSGVTQNWDKNLPSASRFTILPAFNNEAVRDNNTGLVWEKAPGNVLVTWEGATIYCLTKTVGSTTGWRLPSIVELASVLDPSLPAPFVPASIFSGVQSAFYWSATTVAEVPAGAYLVNFGFRTVQEQGKQAGSTALPWCVRGPMNTDAY